MNKELLQRIISGEVTLNDFTPTLILIKTKDEVIPEDAKLSKELIEFLIKTSTDGLPSVIVFYNGKEITL